jgi:hypothetical protein
MDLEGTVTCVWRGGTKGHIGLGLGGVDIQACCLRLGPSTQQMEPLGLLFY